MSLRIATNGSGRSAILLLGAIVLAAALWPLVMRVAEKVTGGLGTPTAASAPKK